MLGAFRCFHSWGTLFLNEDITEVHHNNMVAMMTSLQKFILQRLGSERERRFVSSTLNHLAEFSSESITDIESWMITAFDVEFGPQIGSGGL